MVQAYHSPVKRRALLAVLVLSVGTVFAQPAKKQGHMKDDERRRMREDMREVYRDRSDRPERPRQMSPAERDKLRQDLEETNRALRRKK